MNKNTHERAEFLVPGKLYRINKKIWQKKETFEDEKTGMAFGSAAIQFQSLLMQS